MKRLDNKVAIITGGSVGIGAATAKLFAREGGKVAVTDINDLKGELLTESIQSDGGTAGFWHMDVSKENEVKNTFAEIFNHWGSIEVLVNNASIAGVNSPTDEAREEDWDQVMAVNVKGVFFCTKHAIPYMRKSGNGSIIHLSSIYGIVGATDVPCYNASKGAVREMAKTDAITYAKDGIRVNSVHPGLVWTPMVEEYLEGQGTLEEARKTMDALQPIGHMGEPDDIAYGILYLASDEAKFVTGEELIIDGGYTAQ